MRPGLALLIVAVLLPGCLATKVVTVPVKATAKAAGTIVETGWDAATTTAMEAEEDRAQAARKARKKEERARRKAGDTDTPQR